MKIRLAYLALLVCMGFAGTSRAQLTSGQNLVQTQVVLSVDRVHPGKSLEVAVIADLEKGWHINAHNPTLDYLIPTELRLEPVEHLTVGAIQYPDPVNLKFEFADQFLDVYQDRVVIRFPVTVAEGASPAQKSMEGRLRYQACNDQVCLAPASVDVRIPVEIASLDEPSRSINGQFFSSAPPTSSPTEAPARVVASSKTGDLLRVQTLLSVDNVYAGSTLRVAMITNVQEGWHINAHRPSLEYLIPTEVGLKPERGLQVGEVQYPKPVNLEFEFAGQSLDVYEGQVVFQFPLTVAEGESTGRKTIMAKLRYQACTDTQCLAPASMDVEIPIRIVGLDQPSRPINSDIFGVAGLAAPTTGVSGGSPDGSESELARLIEEKGLFLALVFIFGLGLALNLTPCVYPMIPITIGYFSNQSEGKTSRLFLLALMYLLGIAITYSTLGVVAAVTGQLFGGWLQNMWVLIGIAGVMVLLALSLFGVYQIRPPSFIMQKVSGRAGLGMLGAVSMGLLVGVVAAPCVGPVTIGLLTYVGATGDPWLGFLMFFVLSAGLGAPYVALATFSGGLKKLPKSGVWMIWVERLFGFMLIGLALYFVAPLLPDQVVSWLVIALAAVAGVYLGWIDKSDTGGSGFYWLKKATGVAALLIGIYAVMPSETIAWQHYDSSLVEQAKQEGKPVILDFYADWCIPCRELDQFTFSDEAVIEATSDFVKLKVDMTRFDSPESERLRKKFDVHSVPTIVFLNARGNEVPKSRVIGYLGPDDFIERVKGVISSN